MNTGKVVLVHLLDHEETIVAQLSVTMPLSGTLTVNRMAPDANVHVLLALSVAMTRRELPAPLVMNFEYDVAPVVAHVA